MLFDDGSGAPGQLLSIVADATTTVGAVAAAVAAGPDRRTPPPEAGSTLSVTEFGSSTATTLPSGIPLAEAGVRSGSSIRLARPEDAPTATGPAVATLAVVGGPDAGLEVALHRGVSLIGRAANCAMRLTDPQVSKTHARIEITDRVEVVDANSSNGVVVGGVRVSRAVLGVGDTAELGQSQILVRALAPAAELAVNGSPERLYARPPRVLHRPQVRTYGWPETPAPEERHRFPLLALIAPVVMGVALYLATRSTLSLIFVGLSPLMMFANYYDHRVASREARRTADEEYRARLTALTREVQQDNVVERALLEKLHPPTAVCLRGALAVAEPLWSRRPELPEFLSLRLGTGTIRPTVQADQSRSVHASFEAEEAALRTALDTVTEAPVTVNLTEVGAVGISGPQREIRAILRGLVLQLATLHAPTEVVLTCLAGAAQRTEWEWLRWLPHTASPASPLTSHLAGDSATVRVLLDQLDGLLAARTARADRPLSFGPIIGGAADHPHPALPSVIVIVDSPAADPSRLLRLAERGPEAGVFVLWAAETVTDLPGACRAFLRVHDAATAEVGLVRREAELPAVACDAVTVETAVDVARALAPIVDGGASEDDESDLPRSVPVVSLLGADTIDDATHTLARWQENRSITGGQASPGGGDRAADLRASVGHTGSEPFTLDLRTQGPHALVGGTSGSGKSEFLQAWILGMAYANSPDRVTFLLIDYKGGSAFAKCTALPHCVGLVTDLSPYLVRRAMSSLRAEIRYRELLLNDKGVKDLIELEKTGDPDCPPSLVIVVDELAFLVAEVPDFVDNLVDIAQRGRSLGLHLILAAQRPAGVVRENIRANTNLRVALRMSDEDNSSDVIGTAVAAHFDPSIPGRGVAKTGPGRLVQFQAAYPGARTPAVPPAPPIGIVELGFGASRTWKPAQRDAVSSSQPRDIDRVVESIAEAARLGSIRPPRRPWLEPLAAAYNLEHFNQRTDAAIAIGVLDDPDWQRQVYEFFRPDTDGNILIVGASASGKTTALRTLAIASAVTPRGGPVHVFGIDAAGGSLRNLELMPHVGSIIGGDDDERIQRLMRTLDHLLDERAARYRAVDASELTEFRARAQAPDEPRILLLVDGFPAFRGQHEAAGQQGSVYLTFQRILAEGRSVGVHVAMSADRPASVPSAIAAAFPRKIVLRQTDDEAYAAYSLPRDVLSLNSPAGRAMQVGRPQELQIAILGADGNMAEQARLMRELAVSVERHQRVRPQPIRSLPSLVSVGDLPDEVSGRPVLGVADEDLQPVGFDPTGVILLAGPPQSGRTAAMSWLARSLRRCHPSIELHLLAPRVSPLTSAGWWTHASAGVNECAASIPALVAAYAVAPQPNERLTRAVFVEAAPDFADSDVDALLRELAQNARRHGGLLVAEGETSTWSGTWGLLGELKTSKTGLLLRPDQADGDVVVKTFLPRVRRADFPAGRGLWVKGGSCAKVQLPL
ncbi:MAG: FtsK/SpoIIIE domain-containing protein [Dermatophilaceae bacterium]